MLSAVLAGMLRTSACGTDKTETAQGSGGCDTGKGTLVVGVIAPWSGKLSMTVVASVLAAGGVFTISEATATPFTTRWRRRAPGATGRHRYVRCRLSGGDGRW
ncbi:hypothetical protein GCM10020216_031380 [Nonomuraea helvata]